MSAELQSLIDDLARRLDSPTALEDRLQRMVVYSSHSEPIDEMRRDSILRRTTPPEVVAWFRRFGIAEAPGPLRIPSHPDLGILGRLCAPVRYRGQLMGFLWLIDDEERLVGESVAVVERYAHTAGLLMYQDELSNRLASDVFRNLLSPSEELREASAREIVELGMFPTRRSCAVIVVQPVAGDGSGGGGVGAPVRRDGGETLAAPGAGGDGSGGGMVAPRDGGGDGTHGVVTGWAGEAATAAINRALWEIARDPQGDTLLRLPRSDHAAVLVPLPKDGNPSSAITLAHRVRDTVTRLAGDAGDGMRTVAAVGDSQAQLTRAVVSYRHARLAAQVATVVPSVGDVCEWAKLGVFRALALLPADEIAESVLDPRLRTVFDHGDIDIVETLETYLDLGGDAKATAERLYMHRGTLYNRLKKVERLTGFNLRDGEDRLTAHLGLKLAKLAGLHPLSNLKPA